MSRGRLSLTTVILTLLLAPLAAVSAEDVGVDAQVEIDSIVAVVNEDIITRSELDSQVTLVQQQLRDRAVPLPSPDVLRKQVLDREILKHLQLQLAKNTGIIVDDDTLNKAIDNIAAQNNMSLRQFRDALETEGFDFPSYREEIRGQLIISKLQQRDVQSRITISDQEIDNFLATQFAQGNVDDEYRLRHILVAVPEAASPEKIQNARNKAEAILKELRAGADFSQTAIARSDGKQALEGGDLGWRKAGELPTLFMNVALKMKEGDVSELIRSPSGFHIIKLMGKRTGEQHTLEQTSARHILIRPNELLSEREAEHRLEQLKQRIESGAPFEELARSHSDDRATASAGGNLGWVNQGDLVPQFEDVMRQLKPGDISAPFTTPYGWHIVQVLERRTLDNSEQYKRNKAREFLRQRKLDEMLDAWLRQLRDEAYVEYKSAL